MPEGAIKMDQSRQTDELGRRHRSMVGVSTALAFRVPDELRERLRRVTGALDISTEEVLELGIDLAERRLAAEEYE